MIRLCLCMIVRNEAPVIRRCLASVAPYVDAWCVVDTGSTDGTQDLIRSAAQGFDGPATLHERPWVNFATNRTHALELARSQVAIHAASIPGDAWYLLLIDADEELVVPDGWQWPALNADAYALTVVPDGSPDFSFARHLLLRAEHPWRFEGAVHEDIVSDAPATLGGVVPEIHVLTHADGHRRQNPRKYLDDAMALRIEHERDPGNARTVFYLAQSFRDHWVVSKDRSAAEQALRWYTMRASMPAPEHSAQETWVAAFEVARCREILGFPPSEVIESYLAAHATRPQRAESLANLARYCREIGQPAVAEVFARFTSTMSPGLDHMLVDRSAYGGGCGARVGVITAPREGMNALHFTLVSLLASDTVDFAGVRVFSDSAQTPPCSVPVETESAEELARRKDVGGIYGTLNLARALEWAAGARDVAVTLEDDVMCSREWLRRGRALLEAAECARGESVISLHDMHGPGALGAVAVSVGSDVLLEGTADTYPNGSQGYMMRPATARRLAAQIREKMALPAREERKAWAMDVGMTRLCGTMLLYTDPCLLLHIDGARSTWAAGPEGIVATDEEHARLRKTRRFLPFAR